MVESAPSPAVLSVAAGNLADDLREETAACIESRLLAALKDIDEAVAVMADLSDELDAAQAWLEAGPKAGEVLPDGVRIMGAALLAAVKRDGLPEPDNGLYVARQDRDGWRREMGDLNLDAFARACLDWRLAEWRRRSPNPEREAS